MRPISNHFLPLCLGAMLAGPVFAQSPNTSEGEPAPAQTSTTDAGSQAGFEAWITAFKPRAHAAGLPKPLLDEALSGLRYDTVLITRDRNQNEFTKTIWDYLDTAVSEDRVENGRKAMAANAETFAKIEAEYGVDRHVVAAIWGLESAYGSYRGDISTIGALATLAYDGRRAAFFEAQLIAALQILAAGDVTAEKMRGSWAGAMGHTQFMPTSFQEYAVDFTGDGKRDIWSDDPSDALASAAHYLKRWEWQTGAIWGLEVTLPQGFDYDQTTERVRKPVAEWAALGVTATQGGPLPDHGMASVLLPGGARGVAFLIFQNFQVIERYNTADAYVIAVGHLADRLRGGPKFKASWPRELRALTLEERLDLQRRLTAAGFDTKGVDGRIGPNTIAAIKTWQKANSLLADGYASLEVLQALPNATP